MKKFKLEREDTLIFIIDIQERLAPAMKNGKGAIDNALKLLKAAHIMNINSIATEQYPKGLGNTVEELKNFLDEKNIFSKLTFTGCTEEVKEFLEKESRKNIIISGMETHVCVYQTSRDLLDLGYNVFIVKDAVDSRTQDNYLNGLDLLKEMGAIITNTETVLFDLLKVAGTDEFKAISKLIK